MEIILMSIGLFFAILSIAIFIWWVACFLGEFNICLIIGQEFWNWTIQHETFAVGSVTIILLIAAGLIAGSQLISMRKSRYAELLIHLDEHWESDSIIDIRYKINKESSTMLKQLEKEKLSEAEKHKQLKEKMSEMMKKAEENVEKDFFLIISLLGFFETLAFLTRKGYIPLKDAKDTFGSAMVNYYDLYENYIVEARKEPGNQLAYKELETIVNKLRP